MQQVAEALGVDITTFSRQISTLEKKGLVNKTPDPEDKRVNILSLTEKGDTLEKKIDTRMREFIEKILTQMTDFERELVVKSIQLLNKAILNSGGCCITK